MKLTTVLTGIIGILVLACSSAAPAHVEPTPNIDATVEARLAEERAVDATVEARLKEERASQATSIPSPTNTQAPMPTYTPQPTYTPKTAPTNTPTVVPTATSVPTPTPTPHSPKEGQLTPDGQLIYRNGAWQLLVPITPTPVPGPTPRPTRVPTPTPDPYYTYLDTQVLGADLVLTVDKSPYVITRMIQVPFGITVVIEPGVTVFNDNQVFAGSLYRGYSGFLLAGTLSAVGTSEQPITLGSINIDSGWDKMGNPVTGALGLEAVRSDVLPKITISNAVVLSSFTGRLHVEITDSHLDVSGIVLSARGSTSVLHRNVIGGPWNGRPESWGGKDYPIFQAAELELVNNCFLNAPPIFKIPILTSERPSESPDDFVVKYNTFHTWDVYEQRILAKTQHSENYSIANNYWGGMDDQSINIYIWDSTDDIKYNSTFVFAPTLSEPHPGTPSC